MSLLPWQSWIWFCTYLVASLVIRLPRCLKYSAFSGYTWFYIICIGDGCSEIIITLFSFKSIALRVPALISVWGMSCNTVKSHYKYSIRLLTNNARCKALLSNLRVPQSVNEFHTFCGIWSLIIIFAGAWHCPLPKQDEPIPLPPLFS